MLDLAGINARVLYCIVTGIKITRRQFLMNLVDEIISSSVNNRAAAIVAPDAGALGCRRQCQIMLCKGNKTMATCTKCNKATCGKCAQAAPCVCKKCA